MTQRTVTGPKRFVGKRIKRKEDPRMITGTAHISTTSSCPACTSPAIVRSPYAAAHIDSIDAAAALELPGVVAVFTGADLDDVGHVPCGVSLPGLRIPAHSMLAQGRVYFSGHPVAVVVASDPLLARDAAERVEVDYTPLPAVADPEKALEPGAPPVHPEWPDNVAFVSQTGKWRSRRGLRRSRSNRQTAHAPAARRRRIPWSRAAPLAITKPPKEHSPCHSSTQIPHLLRSIAAAMLGVPEHKMRVIAPEVGGGFGCKADVYAEELLVCFLSRKLGKPVKWVESAPRTFPGTLPGPRPRRLLRDRRQERRHHPRDQAQDHSGHRLASATAHAAIPTLSVLMLPGLYRCKTFRAEVVGAFTNCFPTDAYRGAGRPEATYGIERIVDCLAAELGMDPAEIRLQELHRAAGVPLCHRNRLDLRQRQLCSDPRHGARYHRLHRAPRRAARARARRAGLWASASATYGEICAFGPSPYTPAGGWEFATVRIEPSGTVTVHTGISPHGQGEETTFAQIAADELGVSMDDVVIVHGDTAIVQYGIGTFGSRGTAVGGTAHVPRHRGAQEKDREVRRDAARKRRRPIRPRGMRRVQQDRESGAARRRSPPPPTAP